MSAALVLPPEILIDQPRRKRFTQAEVRKMDEMGFFEGQRYELIEGDLIDKMGQKPPHAYAIQLVLEWLFQIVRGGQIRVQLPIELAREDQESSCPEPDFAIVSERRIEHSSRHPRGDELLLLIEVADTSARVDLTIKASLYARAKVAEYWVIDIGHRVLVVHRHPEHGSYRQVTRLDEKEAISLEGRTGSVVRVSDLMPPKA